MAQTTLEQRVRALFADAPFIRHLEVEVTHASEGVCEASMPLRPTLLQQDGFAHAGVVATLADHCAGGAALSVAAEGTGVLSIEFKVNLLRPASGDRLRCRSSVLRAGRSVTVVESEVFAVPPDAASAEKLVAKAMVTLAIVPRPPPI